MTDTKPKEMRVLDGQGKDLMNIRKMERDGNDLVITGKIMGAMPMKARLTPSQARAGLKMLDLKTILFLVTILFRKDGK